MSAPHPNPDYAPKYAHNFDFDHEPPKIDFIKFEADLTRNLIDEIAERIRKLTYIEMMEFAAAIKASPDTLHKWSTQRD